MHLLLCLLLLVLPFPIEAATTQERLRGTQQQLEEQRRALEETKRQEAAVQAELKRVDEEIRRLEAQLAEAQTRLEAARDHKQVLETQRAQLQTRHDELAERTAQLTRILWTATVQLEHSRQESWAEADREGTWLAAILQEMRHSRAQLQDERRALAAKAAAVQAAAEELAAQERRLAGLKEELTRQRLARVKRAEALRAQRLQGEAQLGSLLSALEALRRQAALEAAQKVSTAKGKLPWPARGRVVGRFAPNASPPSTGIDIATAEKEPVRAVAAGKVVHSDALRGLGQVVIVYHGETYYSVYAFLAETSVGEGQGVAQGDVLGRCGFSPKAKGPGLRFELRSGAKAVNPLEWLAPTP